MAEQKKFVIILNAASDKPDTAAGAMQLAANMKAFDVELDFFLMDQAALLAKKGFAETIIWQKKGEFSPLPELLKTLTEELDVKFHVCASCAKYFELTQDQLIEGADIRPGSYLAEMLMERQSLNF